MALFDDTSYGPVRKWLSERKTIIDRPRIFGGPSEISSSMHGWLFGSAAKEIKPGLGKRHVIVGWDKVDGNAKVYLVEFLKEVDGGFTRTYKDILETPIVYPNEKEMKASISRVLTEKYGELEIRYERI